METLPAEFDLCRRVPDLSIVPPQSKRGFGCGGKAFSACQLARRRLRGVLPGDGFLARKGDPMTSPAP